MTRPSRLMPRFVARPVNWWQRALAYVALMGFVVGYAWAIWRWPLPVLGLSVAVVLAAVVENRRWRAHLRGIAESRKGESICTFVQALPVRELDTWVVRAVFEELQDHMRDGYPAFPLRPSDRLFDDLKVDPEDLEEQLVVRIAQRTSRSLMDSRANPYYGKVTTVEGLVRFFCAQAKGAT